MDIFLELNNTHAHLSISSQIKTTKMRSRSRCIHSFQGMILFFRFRQCYRKTIELHSNHTYTQNISNFDNDKWSAHYLCHTLLSISTHSLGHNTLILSIHFVHSIFSSFLFLLYSYVNSVLFLTCTALPLFLNV